MELEFLRLYMQQLQHLTQNHKNYSGKATYDANTKRSCLHITAKNSYITNQQYYQLKLTAADSTCITGSKFFAYYCYLLLQGDPFSGVNDAFKIKLRKEQKLKLREVLIAYDLDQFLESLYEFITTHVQYCKESEKDEE